MNRSALLLLAAPLLLGTTGCYPWFLFDDFEDDEPTIDEPSLETPPPSGDTVAPTITVNRTSWPPMNGDARLDVTVRDDSGSTTLEATFADSVFYTLSGVEASVAIDGFSLGEGYGALQLEAEDLRGNVRYFTIDNFLVDLSPPEVVLGDTVLGQGPNRYFEFWAADAWVLGDVSVRVQGTTVYFEDFEDAYPPSLGEDWDLSLVQVPTLELPGGAVQAEIVLHDGAGNERVEPVQLDVDADPPLVDIVSPASGAQVSGVFEVQLTAQDVGGGPAWIDVALAGTPVATAIGPSATVLVDATDLTPGTWELVATATDEAGLEGVASIPVTIVAP